MSLFAKRCTGGRRCDAVDGVCTVRGCPFRSRTRATIQEVNDPSLIVRRAVDRKVGIRATSRFWKR